ncbi:hypothetical protein HDU96_008164 [Phlyctochytrium bullatum]|nr:hypothetical protein HDU96_008164 [Phlyctochytrium bullatum]
MQRHTPFADELPNTSINAAGNVATTSATQILPLPVILGLGVAGVFVLAAVVALLLYCRRRIVKWRKEERNELDTDVEAMQSPNPTLAVQKPMVEVPDSTSPAAASEGKAAHHLFATSTPPVPPPRADSVFLTSRSDVGVRMVFAESVADRSTSRSDIVGSSSKPQGLSPMEWGWEEVQAWLVERGHSPDYVAKFKAANATGKLLHQLHNNPVLANELLRTELGVGSVDRRLSFVDDLQKLFGVVEAGTSSGGGGGRAGSVVEVESLPPYVGRG